MWCYSEPNPFVEHSWIIQRYIDMIFLDTCDEVYSIVCPISPELSLLNIRHHLTSNTAPLMWYQHDILSYKCTLFQVFGTTTKHDHERSFVHFCLPVKTSLCTYTTPAFEILSRRPSTSFGCNNNNFTFRIWIPIEKNLYSQEVFH